MGIDTSLLLRFISIERIISSVDTLLSNIIHQISWQHVARFLRHLIFGNGRWKYNSYRKRSILVFFFIVEGFKSIIVWIWKCFLWVEITNEISIRKHRSFSFRLIFSYQVHNSYSFKSMKSLFIRWSDKRSVKYVVDILFNFSLFFFSEQNSVLTGIHHWSFSLLWICVHTNSFLEWFLTFALLQ